MLSLILGVWCHLNAMVEHSRFAAMMVDHSTLMIVNHRGAIQCRILDPKFDENGMGSQNHPTSLGTTMVLLWLTYLFAQNQTKDNKVKWIQLRTLKHLREKITETHLTLTVFGCCVCVRTIQILWIKLKYYFEFFAVHAIYIVKTFSIFPSTE